jgi:hypothetical protein
MKIMAASENLSQELSNEWFCLGFGRIANCANQAVS